MLTGASISHVAYADGQFAVTVDGQPVPADKLLVAAGRRPNLADLGLDTVVGSTRPPSSLHGRRAHAGRAEVSGRSATSPARAGSRTCRCTRPPSRRQAILGTTTRQGADYRAVPRVTFTDPEVGSVGHDRAAGARRGSEGPGRLDRLASSTRGWIHKAGNAGLIKLVEDADRGVLVGATSAGPDRR